MTRGNHLGSILSAVITLTGVSANLLSKFKIVLPKS